MPLLLILDAPDALKVLKIFKVPDVLKHLTSLLSYLLTLFPPYSLSSFLPQLLPPFTPFLLSPSLKTLKNEKTWYFFNEWHFHFARCLWRLHVPLICFKIMRIKWLVRYFLPYIDGYCSIFHIIRRLSLVLIIIYIILFINKAFPTQQLILFHLITATSLWSKEILITL